MKNNVFLIKECGKCDGHGWYEIYSPGDPFMGGGGCYRYKCKPCNGTGKVQININNIPIVNDDKQLDDQQNESIIKTSFKDKIKETLYCYVLPTSIMTAIILFIGFACSENK